MACDSNNVFIIKKLFKRTSSFGENHISALNKTKVIFGVFYFFRYLFANKINNVAIDSFNLSIKVLHNLFIIYENDTFRKAKILPKLTSVSLLLKKNKEPTGIPIYIFLCFSKWGIAIENVFLKSLSCTLTQTADVNVQNCVVKSKFSPSSVYQLENKLLDQQALFSESGLFCLFKNKKVLKWKGNFLNWMGSFNQKIKHFLQKYSFNWKAPLHKVKIW